MPSKRNSTAARAAAARKKAEIRLKVLETAIHDRTTDAMTREWAKKTARELRSGIQRTKMYDKQGKRYKSKTEGQIATNTDVLNELISRVPTRTDFSGANFRVTQTQLNMGSANVPSPYSKTETKLFYRATQKFWQGKDASKRNESILEGINTERMSKGLRPLTLQEIASTVVRKNKEAKKRMTVNPMDWSDELDEETKKLHERAMESDNADGEQDSPPGVAAMVAKAVMDAVSKLVYTPDFTKV